MKNVYMCVHFYVRVCKYTSRMWMCECILCMRCRWVNRRTVVVRVRVRVRVRVHTRVFVCVRTHFFVWLHTTFLISSLLVSVSVTNPKVQFNFTYYDLSHITRMNARVFWSQCLSHTRIIKSTDHDLSHVMSHT